MTGVMQKKKFEEQLEILLRIIDNKSLGYLTKNDLKDLCLNSLTLYHKGSAIIPKFEDPQEPIDLKIIQQLKKEYLKDAKNPRVRKSDVDTAEFFAELVFTRFKDVEHLGRIQLSEIKKAIMERKEDAELF